jgi:hypothetical protein
MMIKVNMIDGDNAHVYITTDSPAIGEALQDMEEAGCEDIIALNVTDTADEYHCQVQLKIEGREGLSQDDVTVVNPDGSVLGKPPLTLKRHL